MTDENPHLGEDALKDLLQAQDLTEISVDRLLSFFRDETWLRDHLPNGSVAVDPRTGDRVVYNASRAARPHDVQPEAGDGQEEATCPICAGRTTGVVDWAPLSEGSTFINKNLYPMLYPFEDREVGARGLHFLQWTSSYHHLDWHNMPAADRAIVMARLARLEGKFVRGGAELAARGSDHPYVSVIKNAGAEVGASLSHGHQQIAVSNVMPRRVADHRRFLDRHGQTFGQYLLANADDDLIVRDYGPALLLVPPFMKRPLELILVLKDRKKAHLHEMDSGEIQAIADGWHDAIRGYHALLPRRGRSVAYNVTSGTGAGAGVYFEFHPYTQSTGGFELLGLYVCQGLPEQAAAELRESLAA